jgi:RHS repeat-associated protein
LFTYDEGGRLVEFTNGAGEVIRIRRDALKRIVEQLLPEGRFIRLNYDAAGQLLSAQTQDATVRFIRDALGNVLEERQGEHWVRHQYDALGNRVRSETSFGHCVDHQFDENGLVKKLGTRSGEAIELLRDARGFEFSRLLPGDLSLVQRHDGQGRLLEQRLVSNGAAAHRQLGDRAYQANLVKREFQYDAAGELASKVDEWSGVMRYEYDPTHRLTRILTAHGVAEEFEYDDRGNVTNIRGESDVSQVGQLIYDNGSRLLQAGSIKYAYDAQGRLSSKTEQLPGGVTKYWEFTWDALDQLREVRTPEGAIWKYKYDAFGRRIEKSTAGKTVAYLWDGNAIIQESSSDQTQFWINLPGSSTPIATVQGGEIFSVVCDHIGTPQELFDQHGRLAWHASYRAFGHAEIKNDTGRVQCNFRFKGQYYDKESGLHYNRFRYYDPRVGRYICQDPLRLAGGINSYSYARNPVSWIDPLGLSDFQPTVLGPDATVHRGMQTDQSGNWIPSPVAGAPNGNQLGARTTSSTANQKNALVDMPVKSPGDTVGPSTTGTQSGLSANLNDQTNSARKRVDGQVSVANLPEGLGAIHDSAEGHVTIYPTRDMTFEEYQEKLNNIPWEKGCPGG